jgi:YceI-like domain
MRYAMSNRKLAGVVVLASMTLVGATAARLAMPLTPDSKVWVEGGSTVRDWKCAATALESEVVPTSAETAGLPVAQLVQTAQVAVEVAKLDCGNGTMDGHMRKALKADAHPRLVFALTSYRIDGGNATLVGTLTLAGRENPVEITGTVAEVDGVVRVQAAHTIRMTEWGIKPPSLMLGTMKVRDEVTIHVDVALQR